MTNQELREQVRQRYQRKVAGQPRPDEDDPVFSFVATKPVPDVVFTAADAVGRETVALCVLLRRRKSDEARRLILDCWQVAEEREVELRVYLGYAGSVLWKRPGYEQLRSHVEAGEIDRVLIDEPPSPLASTESERTDYTHFWRSFFSLCEESDVWVESIEPAETIISPYRRPRRDKSE